jgi:hypothetical protein
MDFSRRASSATTHLFKMFDGKIKCFHAVQCYCQNKHGVPDFLVVAPENIFFRGKSRIEVFYCMLRPVCPLLSTHSQSIFQFYEILLGPKGGSIVGPPTYELAVKYAMHVFLFFCLLSFALSCMRHPSSRVYPNKKLLIIKIV